MSASSPLSPEFDKARIASSAPIMPRSPWLASAAWTNCAGLPVEARVAAILRATWPLLPIPVTISRPRAAAHKSSARPNAPSRRRAPAVRARRSRPAAHVSRHRDRGPARRPRRFRRQPHAAAASRRTDLAVNPGSGLSPRLVSTVSSDTAEVFSPKTTPLGSGPRSSPAQPPGQPQALMRENVLLGPAFQVKQGACRKEIEAAAAPARCAPRAPASRRVGVRSACRCSTSEAA